MNSEMGLAEWHHYRNTTTRSINTRTGAVNDAVGLPGHPMNHAERRWAGASSPADVKGQMICWNFNAHVACQSAECERAREIYKKPGQFPAAIQLVMAKRGGFRRNKKIPGGKAEDSVRDIRKAASTDRRSEMNPTQQVSGNPNPAASPVARVSGSVIPVPEEYMGIDYVEQEKDLRNVAHGPWRERAQALPKQDGTHQLLSDDHHKPDYRVKLFTDTRSSM